MQHLHRTTLWRRKRKAASNRGRNRRGNARERFNVRLLAKLLRAFYETGRHGKKRAVSMTEAIDAPIDHTCRAIERALWQRSEPVGLMVLAAWELFRPEEWRRRNAARGAGVSKEKAGKAIERAAVAACVRDYGWSEAEAKKFVSDHRGEPWLAEFAGGSRGSQSLATTPSGNAACPSNFFKISRSTLSYYRNVKPRTREALGYDLRLLGAAPPHYLAR
jgi:hypothetical protein